MAKRYGLQLGPCRLAPRPGDGNELLPTAKRDLPLDTTGLRNAELFGAGAIVQFDFLDQNFSLEAARQAVAEVKENQKYFYGDYYPLTRHAQGPDQFVAYQMHRPDLDAGLVLAFRRAKCDVARISVALGGLKPLADYNVELIDEERHKTTQTVSGRVLAAGFPLTIPQREASLLVRYHEVSQRAK